MSQLYHIGTPSPKENKNLNLQSDGEEDLCRIEEYSESIGDQSFDSELIEDLNNMDDKEAKA